MDHSLMSPTWGDHEHHSKDPLVLTGIPPPSPYSQWSLSTFFVLSTGHLYPHKSNYF